MVEAKSLGSQHVLWALSQRLRATNEDQQSDNFPYAFFLEPDVREGATERIPGFLCVDLEGDLIYGIDKKVLGMLDDLRAATGDHRKADALLHVLEDRQVEYAGRRAPEYSAGADGIILSGTSALRRQGGIRRRRLQ